MLVAVSLLAISLSLLIYHRPPSTWRRMLSPPTPVSGPANDSRAGHVDAPIPVEADPKLPTDPETKRASATDPPSSPSPQTTPKATPAPAANGSVIPTFSLDAHNGDDDEEDEDDKLPPPSFPAMNSAQRASTQSSLMAPPSKPASTKTLPPRPTPSSNLMPPPSRPLPSNLRALPNSSQSMRVPTTGPLPNRGAGLVPNRGPPASNGGLAPTVKTPNARGKVLLSPGHSPLDWANLQRSGKNLAGVPSLIRVTPSQLKHNNGRKGKPAWSSYQGKVYNITPYLPFHPGGEGELRRAAGKDGAKLFMEVHPWVNWENMLGECVVGIMVTEEEPVETGTFGSLEDMD